MDTPLPDLSRFPHPVYTSTVLGPLFDDAKHHHAGDMDRVNRAHLVMLAETGIVAPDAAHALARALDAMAREVDYAGTGYDGTVEDLFFLVEGHLRRRVGPDLAGRLHTGRSRNDMDHALFRAALKREVDALAARGRALAAALIATATREAGTIVVAYTHGQPAQPTTWGHYLGAVIEVLLRDLRRLDDARAVVDLCPMGAAAITTSGFPVDRDRMAELLGFAGVLENSYGCIATADYVTATYGALELMFLHLGRPIQDMQFWASFEAGQLYVPDAFVQISSIMPQKRNPVPIEHLRLLASQTVGRAASMLGVVHNTPFTDMNDIEGENQAFGYGAFRSGGRVLDLLAAFVPSLSVRPDRVARIIRQSCITVTELADTLVRDEGMAFRDAHHVAADVAKAVLAVDGELGTDGYAPFRTAFEAATGRATGMDAARFAEVVSPEHFVAVRDRFGGPAPGPLGRALDGYRARLAALDTQAAERAEREQQGAAALDAAFARLKGG